MSNCIMDACEIVTIDASVFRSASHMARWGFSPMVEYAVIHLKVRHIVVCGHTECGGIKALESSPNRNDEPHIAAWLDLARPSRQKVLDSSVPESEIYLETIKTNVLMQCENLRSYPCVRQGELEGELAVHGWLYDLHTGRILAFDESSERWGLVAEQQL